MTAGASRGEELIPATKAAEIVGRRNAALDLARRGADLIARGHALTAEAATLARRAHENASFHEADHDRREAFRRLFAAFDPVESVEAFRKDLDARTWVRIIDVAGIRRLMDRTAKDDLYRDLAGSVPEVTEETIHGLLAGLAGDARLIFQRGLARAFSDLDRRFKSHDGFKVGARMILTRLFDEWGHWNYHNSARETIADVERVFAVLDGREPTPGELVRAIDASRTGHGPRQGVCESSYFRIRTFQNGNAHLWFTRDDLVDRANLELADYYGAVLPDGVPAGGPEADLRSSSRELSRDLAFYPTPDAVGRALLRHLDLREARVLEPSAGDGRLVRLLLEAGASVTAVEVDPDRCAAIGRHPRLRTVCANFLRWPQSPTFSYVVMNPPFYGTHWIDHVVHAYGFLAPGGELVAVVPATAEFGESKRHVEFRAWATERSECRRLRFEDLPPESFAESGTRVQTAVLRLRRPR